MDGIAILVGVLLHAYLASIIWRLRKRRTVVGNMGSNREKAMNKTNDVARCPQCRVPLPHDDLAPALCTVCGWVSLLEIERQIRYWSLRKLEEQRVMPLRAV